MKKLIIASLISVLTACGGGGGGAASAPVIEHCSTDNIITKPNQWTNDLVNFCNELSQITLHDENTVINATYLFNPGEQWRNMYSHDSNWNVISISSNVHEFDRLTKVVRIDLHNGADADIEVTHYLRDGGEYTERIIYGDPRYDEYLDATSHQKMIELWNEASKEATFIDAPQD